jgi:hypothetical protein
MSRAQLTSTVEQNTGGAVAPYVAGKNAIINGGFDIWQRGTSTAIGTNTYFADRWISFRGSYASGSTVSRQSTNDTTNLPNIQYCTRVQRDSGNTSTNNINIQYSQETSASIPLAGKTVTLSFYARAGANYSSSNALVAQLYTGTGTDQNIATSSYTGIVVAINTTVTLTTTWQRFTATVTLANNTNEFAIGFITYPTGTAGAADYYEITGVQLEIGAVATPFSRAGGTLQGELSLCQRYFHRWADGSQASSNPVGVGHGQTATQVEVFIPLKVTMRAKPSMVVSSAGDFMGVSGGNNLTVTAFATYDASTSGTKIVFNTASGSTAGYAWLLRANSSSATMDFTAEL